MNPITITLPYPISANRYWNSFPLGGRVMTAPSAEAKKYKRDVAKLLHAAGIVQQIKGRVRVDIFLYAKRPQDWQKRMRLHGAEWDNTVQRLDLDNCRKCLYDSIKDIAIEDDFWIWEDGGKVMEPDGEARVLVVIKSVAIEKPQVALFDEVAVEV